MPIKKDIQISKESVEKSDLCARDKACLKNPGVVCPITPDASEELLFVSRKGIAGCKYYVYFGYGGFCKCPVRKEIYREFKK